MLRRKFLALLGAGPALLLLSGTPTVARGQLPGKVHRIGFLANEPLQSDLERGVYVFPGIAEFVDALKKLGWHNGKNIEIVWKSAEGIHPRHPQLAAELVRVPVDVIVASGPGVDAAANASSSIPIVTAGSYSPVQSGLAQSLARPGRNVTGVAMDAVNPMSKMLALLKEALPGISRVAVVGQARNWAADGHPVYMRWSAFSAPARALGIEPFYLTFGDVGTLKAVMESAVRQGAPALLFENPPPLHTPDVQRLIAAEARRHRVPVIIPVLAAAANGVLMAYGTDPRVNSRLAARYVDRILRGERAAEIPIEQPRALEFHLNLAAARAIGLDMPRALLLQADRVFQ